MDRVSIGRMIIMPYQYMLFDLDGTLTDPGLGITNSVMHALRQMGAAVPERAALYPFIGPPLKDSFHRFFGFTEEQCGEAIRYYREYFKRQGIFENEVYEGVRELLAGLKKEGKTLAVATSKPEVFAIEILKHFDLFQYFDALFRRVEILRIQRIKVIPKRLDEIRFLNDQIFGEGGAEIDFQTAEVFSQNDR